MRRWIAWGLNGLSLYTITRKVAKEILFATTYVLANILLHQTYIEASLRPCVD
jgi:hypothetical protein